MTTTIKIQNLKCGGCANTIITKLSAIEKVENVSVNVEDSSVAFTTASENEVEIVKNKLADLGYPVEGDTNSVISKAKSFVSCATGRINK